MIASNVNDFGPSLLLERTVLSFTLPGIARAVGIVFGVEQ